MLACSAMACQSTPSPGSAGTPVTVSTPTVVQEPPSNPAAQVTPAAAWEHYTNSKWNYSLNYPQQWFSLSNNGAPDTDKYFSSENVGSPPEMTRAATVPKPRSPTPPRPGSLTGWKCIRPT